MSDKKYFFLKTLFFISNLILIKSQLEDPCLPAQKCVYSVSTVNDVKCSAHGKCFYDVMAYYASNKTLPFQNCICDEGYTDLVSDADVKCCYKRKSQFMAFLLEFTLSFGLGHFYLGNFFIGCLKLVSFVILCCTCCTIACCFCYRNEYNNVNVNPEDVRNVGYHKGGIDDNKGKFDPPLKMKIFNLVMIFSCFGYFFWQIADLVLFGMNFFKDSNGVELSPW